MGNVVWVCSIVALAATSFVSQRLVDAPANWTPGFVWEPRTPADCPFPQSTAFDRIYFTGRHSDYYCGDTWYPTWAADGNLYSPWTDGVTGGVQSGSGQGAEATTGNAVLIGEDPVRLEIRNTSPPQVASALPYLGRYPCGSLVHRGIWYYGTYCLGPAPSVEHEGMQWNWPVLGPMPGFRVSTDYGKTWAPSPLSPERPLFPEPATDLGPVRMGAPHFVDFGRDLEHSRDGKAYLVGMGAEADDPLPRYANLSWITADQLYLARVAPGPERINDLGSYEFYAGRNPAGEPVWSSEFEDIRPLLEWNNRMGCATVTYNAPLRKYLMCVTDGWPTVATMDSYILEADSITGPWRLIAFLEDFGEQAYFLNFPSKFIGPSGRDLWLCFSANFSNGWNGVELRINPPGGRYGLCLHETRLLSPGETAPEPTDAAVENPLTDSTNVAPQAEVTVSSSCDGYQARGAVDGRVGGFPGAVAEEWATSGEAAGAWIGLRWASPQRIDRVWLFDRPNALDQVTAGVLTFGDGTSIVLAMPLPDGGRQGVEITFEPTVVDELRFTVSGVRAGSPNIGLSEIAVFAAPHP